MTIIQDWISRKFEDEALFPTDPQGATSSVYPDHIRCTDPPSKHDEDWLGCRSGFPKKFAAACRLISRQIFRMYAHLYWNHFEDFYHLNLEKTLNSCFSTFLMVATTHGLLQSDDLQPMQDLVNLWAANGIFPADSRPYGLADLARGKSLSDQIATR
jgi:hypothetical protein